MGVTLSGTKCECGLLISSRRDVCRCGRDRVNFNNSTTKRCTKCLESKTTEHYSPSKSSKDGYQGICKDCRAELRRQYYQDNIESVRIKEQARSKKRHFEYKAKIWKYLEKHPCDCGISDIRLLEFNHLDISLKIENVSRMVVQGRPWNIIEQEIAKCEVLCAKCHRRKTVAAQGSYRTRNCTTTGTKRKLQEYICDYLEDHPCVICGEDELIFLDFDHIDPKMKTYAISFMVNRNHLLENIIQEISKCQILCIHCHKIKSSEDGGHYQLPDTISSTTEKGIG